MGLYEDPERILQIEKEMSETWTKFRAGDKCKVIGNVLKGETVTIKFPYLFTINGEQSYVCNEHPMSLAESELEFVSQKLYGFK